MVRYTIHITLGLCAFSPGYMMSQDSTGCFSGNLKACVKANGMMSSWETPAGSGRYVLNNACLWFSASDATGTVRVAAHAFDQSGTDFTPGPLALNGGAAANPALWNKVYQVNAADINYHKSHFRNEGYTVSPSLTVWPGNGESGFAPILAPFVDYGSFDQKYTPVSGDYPYIAGEEAVYSIFNDAYTNHSYSNAPALGIEVQSMFYLYPANTGDSVKNNTILGRIVVHNRSTRSYNNFRMSLLVNHILGDDADNFLTTDVSNRAIICYNGDDSDKIYGKYPPAFATVLLNKNMHSTMYVVNNSGQINSKPVNATEFRNLMTGKWRNGKQLVYGGEGIDNGQPARYIYPDDQDPAFPSTPWTEDIVGNTPGYRISLLNADSVSLQSGAFVTYEIAFVFVDEKIRNIQQIRDFVGAVKSAYEKGQLTSVKKMYEKSPSVLKVYPNPATYGNTVFFEGLEEQADKVEILDGNMRVIMTKELAENEKSVILDKNFESGLYFIHLISCKNSYLQRITIQ